MNRGIFLILCTYANMKTARIQMRNVQTKPRYRNYTQHMFLYIAVSSFSNELRREPLTTSLDKSHRHLALAQLNGHNRAHACPHQLPRPLVRKLPDFLLPLIAQSLFRLAIFQEHADVQLDRIRLEDHCQDGQDLDLREASADAAAVAVGEGHVGAPDWTEEG